jgi:nucleoid DNA-binding protein
MASKKPMKKKAAGAAKKAKPAVSRKASAVSKQFTKSEIVREVAAAVEISTKQASRVLEELAFIIERHLKKGGPGIFVLPGLAKFQVIHKPATKARKGINPFTGEETMFKAKPARNVVKVRALKKLKDMV